MDKAGLTVDRAQSQNTAVGPTLGKEYLQKSLLALVIALGLQLLYIAFRFGNQLRVPLLDVGCICREIFQNIVRILPAQQGVHVPANQQAILARRDDPIGR